MSEEVSGVLSVPNKPSGFCGRKAIFTYLLTLGKKMSAAAERGNSRLQTDTAVWEESTSLATENSASLLRYG